MKLAYLYENNYLAADKRHEAGLGTLEIVLIISVLIAAALIFRNQLLEFANVLMQKVFDHSII